MPTNHRRRRLGPSPRRGTYPASAEERREHFRLGASRTVAALLAFLAALAIFVLGASL